jgi:hypothetical protein
MNNLTLQTFYLHETLTDENIERYNSSNNVIISKYLFDNFINSHLLLSNDTALTIELHYNNKKIYVNIIDSHNTEDTIVYVPLWIYEYLNYTEDDLVSCIRVYPETGNKIKIKPRSDFYAYLDDPVTALRNGFEEYSCLVKDTVISININGIQLDVEILETYINNESSNNQPIYIRGIELEVDIESNEPEPEPVQEPELEPEPEPDFDSMLPPSYSNNISKFPGKGNKLV